MKKSLECSGASVEDMKPEFEEFKLTVRLYNCIGQKIYDL